MVRVQGLLVERLTARVGTEKGGKAKPCKAVDITLNAFPTVSTSRSLGV